MPDGTAKFLLCMEEVILHAICASEPNQDPSAAKPTLNEIIANVRANRPPGYPFKKADARLIVVGVCRKALEILGENTEPVGG